MTIFLIAILSVFSCPFHIVQTASLDHDQQKCTVPNDSSALSPSRKLDAMKALFETEFALESFFDTHFERSFLHVGHSARSNRSAWMQYYRRFLPSADLDLILSHNASSTNPTANLTLHHDLDVFRIAKTKFGTYSWTALSTSTHLDSLRSAVRDGAVLHLYHMSSRSRQLANFEDALRDFWAVPVSSTFSFHPLDTYVQPAPAPSIYAGDLFVVIIHGNADARLYGDYFPFPCLHHIDSPAIHEVSYKSITSSKTINIDEGDVLYVPRGTALDIRTRDSPALIVSFEVRTDQRMLFHGVLRSIDIVREKSDLLNTAIHNEKQRTSKEEKTEIPKWSNVIKTSVNMAAEVTPAMRRFLPVTGKIMPVLDSIGMDVGAELIEDTIGRFSKAATDALFNPMLEILKSNEAEAFADRSIITWARHMWNGSNSERKRAGRAFQAAIRDISVTSSAPSDAEALMSLEWNEQQMKRAGELRSREISLQRHGELKADK